MKRSLLLPILFAAIPALANPSEWLTCSTIGDASGPMFIGVNGIPEETDTVLVRVESLADPEEDPGNSYTADVAKGTLDKLNSEGHLEILLRSAESAEFGGGISDAGLLNLRQVDQKITATLAHRGLVLEMTCEDTIKE